jgi:tripartite-type tricarboxylate transporter receptor subunit TctC
VRDLVALCRKNPGKFSFASAGGGSAQHFALEMFKQQAKIFALHVPYRGSGPALTDLIGGQVNYCFRDHDLGHAPHQGRPRDRAGPDASEARQGPPHRADDGRVGLPGFEATVWYGLMGPGRMPRAMAQRMNDDINRVMAMPDVQEKMDQYGAEDGGGSIEKFANFIKSEQQKWAVVAKAANVKVDA